MNRMLTSRLHPNDFFPKVFRIESPRWARKWTIPSLHVRCGKSVLIQACLWRNKPTISLLSHTFFWQVFLVQSKFTSRTDKSAPVFVFIFFDESHRMLEDLFKPRSAQCQLKSLTKFFWIFFNPLCFFWVYSGPLFRWIIVNLKRGWR